MSDNPVHTFVQLLGGQIPDQLALRDPRWLTVGFHWLLMTGGVAVATINWHRDPAQRSGHHLVIFAMRFAMAGMWYLVTPWKLPPPASAGFKFWLSQTVKYRSFRPHGAIMRGFLDHIAIAQPLACLLELFITLSLMLGFMVCASGVLAALTWRRPETLSAIGTLRQPKPACVHR